MKKQLTIAALITAACIVFTGCAGISDNSLIRDLPFASAQETIRNTEAASSQETMTDRGTMSAEPGGSVGERVKLTGKGLYRGLDITASCSEPRKVDIHFENTSSDGYSLGWVNGPTITCATTAGEYYYSAGSTIIRAGGMADITGYFDDAEGEIQYIVIDNVNMLTSRGLPSNTNGGDTVYISFADNMISEPSSEVSEVKSVKTGTADLEGLQISVVANDSKSVTVEYINNSGTDFSLGWVNGLTVTCTTTAGEYYFASNMAQIKAGGSLKENYYFDSAEGELLSVTLSGIHFLNNGLPSDFGGGEYITIEMNDKP